MAYLNFGDYLSLAISLIALITSLWKFFSFFNKINHMVTITRYLEDKHTIEESFSNIYHSIDKLEEGLNAKLDASNFDLLRKDIDFLKEKMITREEFLEFKSYIKDLITKR